MVSKGFRNDKIVPNQKSSFLIKSFANNKHEVQYLKKVPKFLDFFTAWTKTPIVDGVFHSSF